MRSPTPSKTALADAGRLARGRLGAASNNIAEYTGLLHCMRRAVRRPTKRVLFRVDSLLVARHQAFDWACKSAELHSLYEECVELGKRLHRQGKEWTIEHVYREFNATADELANRGVDNEEEFHVETGSW